MGAEYQDTTIDDCAEPELQAAFDRIVERAQYDYGHGGYSGSFAEMVGEDVNVLSESFAEAGG